MRNTFNPEDLWIKSLDEFVTTGSADREVYFKRIPPPWQFWASPTFHNVSPYFENLEYAERERRVNNNPHLYFREEAYAEYLARTRGPFKTIRHLLASVYNPKYLLGPGRWLEKVTFSCVLVLGTLHFIS